MRVSKQQFRYITETLRKFCAEREFLDLIPYPAAFTEAALLSAHRGVASDKEVVFDLGDIESTLRRVPAAQLRAARAVRRARNRAAHGHLIETASDLPALSWAAEALLVTFVLSVAPKRLVSHVLDTLVDDSPLLTSILQQKPTLPLDSLSANSHHTAVVEASTALWPHLGPKSSRLDRPDAFFATRNVGDLMDGTVVDVTADGASVSLDNCVEALLRADDIDWQPVDDARNHLTIGQVISVQITALNGDDGVVEVSMKGAIPHPLFSKLAIGGTVTARILDMGAFGCRVDLDHGVVVTLLASTDDTADLAIGGRVELVVRAMDRTSGKLDLAFPRSGAAAKLRNLK
jgi:predicted RNA-binding protein with RPS1 domain